MPLGLEISSKACLFLNIFSGDPYFDVLVIGLFCMFMGVFWCVKGEVAN